MDTSTVLQRLRTFLLVLAGLVCVGVPVELWLAEHMESPTQLIPFALCGAGLLAVAAVLLRPSRITLLALRVVMLLLIIGSGLGVYEHLAGNLAFAQEIRPNATLGAVWLDALRGANPLLAPGALALAALLALGATYAHPLLHARAQRSAPAVVER